MEDERRQRVAGLKQDFERTFTTEHGMRVLAHIDDCCFKAVTTATRDSHGRTDPSGIVIKEGRRQVSLMIHEQLELTVEQLLMRLGA